MNDTTSPISLFNSWGEPPSFAILHSMGNTGVFNCLYSCLNRYEERVYSIYELPEVLRLVGKKMDLFTNGLQEELGLNQTVLPIILEWEPSSRNVLILDLKTIGFSFEEIQEKVNDVKKGILAWSNLQNTNGVKTKASP